jgi:hypothetical protein
VPVYDSGPDWADDYPGDRGFYSPGGYDDYSSGSWRQAPANYPKASGRASVGRSSVGRAGPGGGDALTEDTNDLRAAPLPAMRRHPRPVLAETRGAPPKRRSVKGPVVGTLLLWSCWVGTSGYFTVTRWTGTGFWLMTSTGVALPFLIFVGVRLRRAWPAYIAVVAGLVAAVPPFLTGVVSAWRAVIEHHGQGWMPMTFGFVGCLSALVTAVSVGFLGEVLDSAD